MSHRQARPRRSRHVHTRHYRNHSRVHPHRRREHRHPRATQGLKFPLQACSPRPRPPRPRLGPYSCPLHRWPSAIRHPCPYHYQQPRRLPLALDLSRAHHSTQCVVRFDSV